MATKIPELIKTRPSNVPLANLEMVELVISLWGEIKFKHVAF